MVKVQIDKDWLLKWAVNWPIPKQAIDDLLEHAEIVDPEPQEKAEVKD